jgi:hypothetical protein
MQPVLIMRVPQRGASKGTPSTGKDLAPCYGFMENVNFPSSSESPATDGSWFGSWLWEDYSQVCYPSV